MHSDQVKTATFGFQSHLFKSMYSYLCDQNRVQPIIGLSSVIEFCTDSKPPVYLCKVCVLRLNVKDIKTHIMGSLHRYNYIKSSHTHELGADSDLAAHAWHLLELAKLIEKKEGTGNVQVLHLHEDIYKEMESHPVLDVLAQVEQINNQPIITELQLPLCSTVTQDRDPTAQSTARSLVQFRSPAGYPLPNCISPTTAFTSFPAAAAFQRGNPIGDSVPNVTAHENKTVKRWGNYINAFECTESPSAYTVQTTNPKFKRVAWCQNNSLTVTITQKPSPEHINDQDSIQDHLTTLKLISTGENTPAVFWNEHQCQMNNYLTSEEPFRDTDTDWVLQNRNVGQEDWQHLQPFIYESVGQYQQPQDYSEEHTVPLPRQFEESPEHYSGTQPLIGLHAVIKCQSVAGDPPSFCFLCQPCCLKVLKSDIIHHLISPMHQINYINFQYPHLSQCHTGIQSLRTTAMQLEQEEGRGQMEVRRLSACLFDEILEQDFHWSMKILNCGSSDQRRLNQKVLSKKSTMTPDYSVPLKRSAGIAGITEDFDENGAPRNPPLSHKRANKNVFSLKNARLSEPVFKVSLFLSEGPLLVDRIPAVTVTVAPEIE